MRRILLLSLGHLGLLAGNPLFADVVTLKDGRQISGAVESGNTQELHIKGGAQSQTIDILEVRTIQLGASLPTSVTAPPPAKAATATPAASEHAPDQPNGLFLIDGTQVAGKWWSIDATDIHFLVDDQLQHYPRVKVLGITFGAATLPPPPARGTIIRRRAAAAPFPDAPLRECTSGGPARSLATGRTRDGLLLGRRSSFSSRTQTSC
jgi:hypothetical protein